MGQPRTNEYKAVKSYEAVPRVRQFPADETGKRVGRGKSGQSIEDAIERAGYHNAPQFGVWTVRMLSALRTMWTDAHAIGDDALCEQVMRAYKYLYTRDTRATKRPPGTRKKRKNYL